MRKIKRIRITVETERLVISKHSRVLKGWCDGCGRTVELVTLEEAAALAGTDARIIRRQIEANLLHYAEMPDGECLICLNSLLP